MLPLTAVVNNVPKNQSPCSQFFWVYSWERAYGFSSLLPRVTHFSLPRAPDAHTARELGKPGVWRLAVCMSFPLWTVSSGWAGSPCLHRCCGSTHLHAKTSIK